jgi:hypothetical protein
VAATTITAFISIIRSTNMTSPTDDHSDPVIPFIGDRGLSHDALADLERVAFATEGDPATAFEPADFVTRTETEMWVLAGMLARRGLYQHAHAVAEIAAEWHSATEQYLQELRGRSQS